MKNYFLNMEVKNASWIIGGKILQLFISLIVNILTARYLGPDNYGLINYGAAYVAFFSSLCTLGINSIIIKDFLDYPSEQGKTLGTAIILRILSSAFSAIMIVGIAFILDKQEPMTVVVVALCSVALIFQVFDTINFWFQSRYQSKVTSIAGIFAYIVVAIYKFILLFFYKDVRWFAFSTSVDYICVAMFLMIAYKRYGGPKLEFSMTKAKGLWNKSYHYILSGMMVAIYGQTDKFMIKQILTDADVGFYSVATAICATWVFVLQAIIDSIYPTIINLHKNDKLKFERKNRQLYGIVFYVSVVVSIFFVIFGKYIVLLLYGEAYLDSVIPLKIVTWYTAFSYLGVARNAWMVCENKQKYLKYLYLSAAIINVILNAFTIPKWGISGAAIASLITNVATSMILPMLIKEIRPNTILMLEAITLKDFRKRHKY